MSYAKRQLEQELAEVASGRRETVSAGAQSQVSWEEHSEREKRQAHEAELERVSAEQLKATQEGHRRALEVSREALRVQRASDELAREHQKEIAQAAMQQLNFAKEVEDAAERRHDQIQHDNRIQSSPTYSAVLRLVELRKLERQLQEEKEIEDLLAPAVAAFDALKVALQVFSGERTDNAMSINKANEAESALRESAIAAAAVLLGDLQAELDATASELKRYQFSLNPTTWRGEYAKRRRELQAAVSELRTRISSKEREIQHLDQRAEPIPVTEPSPKERAEHVKALCQESAIASLVATIDAEIEAWLSHDIRSDEIQWLFGWPRSDGFEIDYDLCVTLDHAIANGAASISYPSLGQVPLGASLVAAIEKIALMRKSAPSFAIEGAPPKGVRELQALRAAVDCGYFPSGPEEKLIPLGRLSGNPELIRAASVVLLNQEAKVSTLQRHLQVSYVKAASLLERLEQAGIVSSANGAGQRTILANGPE